MNRQKRREVERGANHFEQRKSFAPNEVKEMNLTAFDMGARYALEAVALEYGLGEKRLKKVQQRLEWLWNLDEIKDFRGTGNVNRLRLNRAARRALDNSKKGAVLDE